MKNRIKEMRQSKGMSQQDLADLIGDNATKGQISKLETGAQPLTEKWMLRVSEALKVQPYQLLVQNEVSSNTLEKSTFDREALQRTLEIIEDESLNIDGLSVHAKLEVMMKYIEDFVTQGKKEEPTRENVIDLLEYTKRMIG